MDILVERSGGTRLANKKRIVFTRFNPNDLDRMSYRSEESKLRLGLASEPSNSNLSTYDEEPPNPSRQSSKMLPVGNGVMLPTKIKFMLDDYHNSQHGPQTSEVAPIFIATFWRL